MSRPRRTDGRSFAKTVHFLPAEQKIFKELAFHYDMSPEKVIIEAVKIGLPALAVGYNKLEKKINKLYQK